MHLDQTVHLEHLFLQLLSIMVVDSDLDLVLDHFFDFFLQELGVEVEEQLEILSLWLEYSEEVLVDDVFLADLDDSVVIDQVLQSLVWQHL